MNEKFLEGKGVLITGAATGFGKGVALEYAKRGADLVLVDIKKEQLEDTSKEIKRIYDQKVVPIICDVSKSDQVKEMVKKTWEELDNIFILFNNAGISPHYGLNVFRTKEDEYDLIMQTNLKSQWLVTKALAKKIKRQNFRPLAGKIICNASIAGVKPNSALPVYSISKSGVITLMKIFAHDLAPKVTVNSISPGYHATPIYNSDPDLLKQMLREGSVKTPLDRLGTVEDVVNLMVFLASPASDFITGHNFMIDGGIGDVGIPATFLKSDI
ncbi:MAG: SDR family NAD(P)-dependent oxidoreductase [Candidatus Thorarchaeota archaeon]